MKVNQIALVTPKNYLPLFVSAADRAYFSNPILITNIHTINGTTMVTDPARGETYPVNPQHLKPTYNLTNRQRSAMGL